VPGTGDADAEEILIDIVFVRRISWAIR
jgi:hypothetical protein